MSLGVWITSRFGFAPGLNLVPRTFPGPRDLLRFGRRWEVHWRKSGRAKQRICQSAIFGSQAGHFPFEQADVAAV